MASGFGGRYQGSVVDDADPIGEHRLRVIVPEVWGTEAGAWAVPSLPPGGAATPAVGDLVWVTFEGGDTDYPIWDAGAAPDPDAVPADGHVGRYRALVADNVDPMEEHRLNVKIPEVLGDDTTAYTRPALDEGQRHRAAVFEWLIWYNADRLHSALDYQPPVEYEQHLTNHLHQAA